jgi:hypothetical protein
MQWMRLMIISCGMALKRIGMCRVSVRKMKALTIRMKTLTLVGTGR